MDTENKAAADAPPVRQAARAPVQTVAMASMPLLKTHAHRRCEDCRVENAFHAWRDQHLGPSFNTLISFASWGIPPAGKRAVIELVTAVVLVPHGEKARLRFYTSLGSVPSNLDLVLIPQGQLAGGQDVLTATHSLRAYSDSPVEFDVNRDNAQTEGDALICISGYLIDV
jgi:hypothetical protein